MKRAVVLAGGGSLGAFEIGVWKYLREHAIDYEIVTGTSIGSINAAFMAEHDFDKAVATWSSISIDEVIHNGFNLTSDFFSSVDRAKRAEIRDFAKSYFSNHGADVRPLYQLVRSSVDAAKVKSSNVVTGVVACQYPSFTEKDFILSKLTPEQIIAVLNCSSACYPIFPPYSFQKRRYVDGGYRNNLPIDLALRLGAGEIIAISLDPYPHNPQHFEMASYPFVKVIRPAHPTGSFLNFDAEQAVKNIERGYIEARKRFGELWGFTYAFEKETQIEGEALAFCQRLACEKSELFPKVQKELAFEGNIPTNVRDIYLRAYEEEGEILGVDYEPIYAFSAFKKAVNDKLAKELAKGPSNFLKKPIPLWKVKSKDRKAFLVAMEEIYLHKGSLKALAPFFDQNPLLYALALIAAKRNNR